MVKIHGDAAGRICHRLSPHQSRKTGHRIIAQTYLFLLFSSLKPDRSSPRSAGIPAAALLLDRPCTQYLSSMCHGFWHSRVISLPVPDCNLFPDTASRDPKEKHFFLQLFLVLPDPLHFWNIGILLGNKQPYHNHFIPPMGPHPPFTLGRFLKKATT